LTNRTPRFWKAVFVAVVKSLQRVSDPDNYVRLTGGPLAAKVPGGAYGPEGERVVVWHRALARLGLADGDTGSLDEARSVSVASE
jgi:hypothetical protein